MGLKHGFYYEVKNVCWVDLKEERFFTYIKECIQIEYSNVDEFYNSKKSIN